MPESKNIKWDIPPQFDEDKNLLEKLPLWKQNLLYPPVDEEKFIRKSNPILTPLDASTIPTIGPEAKEYPSVNELRDRLSISDGPSDSFRSIFVDYTPVGVGDTSVSKRMLISGSPIETSLVGKGIETPKDTEERKEREVVQEQVDIGFNKPNIFASLDSTSQDMISGRNLPQRVLESEIRKVLGRETLVDKGDPFFVELKPSSDETETLRIGPAHAPYGGFMLTGVPIKKVRFSEPSVNVRGLVEQELTTTRVPNVITDLSTVWDKEKGTWKLEGITDMGSLRTMLYRRRKRARNKQYETTKGETELVPVLQAIQEEYYPDPDKFASIKDKEKGRRKDPYHTSMGYEKEPTHSIAERDRIVSLATTVEELQSEVESDVDVWQLNKRRPQESKEIYEQRIAEEGEYLLDDKGQRMIDYTKLQGVGGEQLALMLGPDTYDKLVGIGGIQAKGYGGEEGQSPRYGYIERKWVDEKDLTLKDKQEIAKGNAKIETHWLWDKNQHDASYTEKQLEKYKGQTLIETEDGDFFKKGAHIIIRDKTEETRRQLPDTKTEFGEHYGKGMTTKRPSTFEKDKGIDFPEESIDKRYADPTTVEFKFDPELDKYVYVRSERPKHGKYNLFHQDDPYRKTLATIIQEQSAKLAKTHNIPNLNIDSSMISDEELILEAGLAQGFQKPPYGVQITGISRDDVVVGSQEYEYKNPRRFQQHAAHLILNAIEEEKRNLTDNEYDILKESFTQISRNQEPAPIEIKYSSYAKLFGGEYVPFKKWYYTEILGKIDSKGDPKHHKLNQEGYSGFGKYYVEDVNGVPNPIEYTPEKWNELTAKKLHPIILKKASQLALLKDADKRRIHDKITPAQRQEHLAIIFAVEKKPENLDNEIKNQLNIIKTEVNPSDVQLAIKDQVKKAKAMQLSSWTRKQQIKAGKKFPIDKVPKHRTDPLRTEKTDTEPITYKPVEGIPVQTVHHGEDFITQYDPTKPEVKMTTITDTSSNFTAAMTNGSLLDELQRIMGEDISPFSKEHLSLHRKGDEITPYQMDSTRVSVFNPTKDSRDIMEHIEARREFDIHDYAKEFEIPEYEERHIKRQVREERRQAYRPPSYSIENGKDILHLDSKEIPRSYQPPAVHFTGARTDADIIGSDVGPTGDNRYTTHKRTLDAHQRTLDDFTPRENEIPDLNKTNLPKNLNDELKIRVKKWLNEEVNVPIRNIRSIKNLEANVTDPNVLKEFGITKDGWTGTRRDAHELFGTMITKEGKVIPQGLYREDLILDPKTGNIIDRAYDDMREGESPEVRSELNESGWLPYKNGNRQLADISTFKPASFALEQFKERTKAQLLKEGYNGSTSTSSSTGGIPPRTTPSGVNYEWSRGTPPLNGGLNGGTPPNGNGNGKGIPDVPADWESHKQSFIDADVQLTDLQSDVFAKDLGYTGKALYNAYSDAANYNRKHDLSYGKNKQIASLENPEGKLWLPIGLWIAQEFGKDIRAKPDKISRAKGYIDETAGPIYTKHNKVVDTEHLQNNDLLKTVDLTITEARVASLTPDTIFNIGKAKFEIGIGEHKNRVKIRKKGTTEAVPLNIDFLQNSERVAASGRNYFDGSWEFIPMDVTMGGIGNNLTKSGSDIAKNANISRTSFSSASSAYAHKSLESDKEYQAKRQAILDDIKINQESKVLDDKIKKVQAKPGRTTNLNSSGDIKDNMPAERYKGGRRVWDSTDPTFKSMQDAYLNTLTGKTETMPTNAEMFAMNLQTGVNVAKKLGGVGKRAYQWKQLRDLEDKERIKQERIYNIQLAEQGITPTKSTRAGRGVAGGAIDLMRELRGDGSSGYTPAYQQQGQFYSQSHPFSAGGGSGVFAGGSLFSAGETQAMMGGGQSALTDFSSMGRTSGSSLTDFKDTRQMSSGGLTDMGARALAGGNTLSDFGARVGTTSGHLGGTLAQQMSGQAQYMGGQIGGTYGIFTSGKEFLESRGKPTSLKLMGGREKDVMSFSLGGTLGIGGSREESKQGVSGFRKGELVTQRRNRNGGIFGMLETQPRAPNGSQNGSQMRTNGVRTNGMRNSTGVGGNAR